MVLELVLPEFEKLNFWMIFILNSMNQFMSTNSNSFMHLKISI